MRVSLVTTVRNEASSIDELAECIRLQTRQPEDWIVVDGGSVDGTAERLARRGSCRVFVEPGNIAHGRNAAIRHTDTEIVAVTDAGCRPYPNWLSSIVAPIERGQAEATGGCTVPRIRTPFDAAQWALLDQFAVFGLRAPSLSSRSFAFRRELWEAQPYPEWLDFGEDRWLFDAWRRRGVSIQFVEEAVVEWEMRAGLGALWRQHFHYMRGDGRARMRSAPNALRWTFYGTLAALAATGEGAAIAAATLWLAYMMVTGVRLPGALAGRSWDFSARAAVVFPLALATMDSAKLTGYVTGLAQQFVKSE